MNNVSTTDANAVVAPVPASAASTAADKLKAADQVAQSQSSQSVDDHAQSCPLISRYAIEALVVGEDDKPLMDVAVELRKSPNEVLRDRTSTDGVVRFEQLVGGSYQLSLYELDKDAWELLETVALAQPKSQGDAAWQVPGAASGVPDSYVAVQGDSIASISQTFGYFPKMLWESGGNASLKNLRENMNVLFPGDEVKLPPPRFVSIGASTGNHYKLKRKGVPEIFKVRFLNCRREARANIAYTCVTHNARDQVFPSHSGATDGAGMLSVPVPLDATLAKVTLHDEGSDEVYEFQLGYMNPLHTDSGIASRLINLGYLSDDAADDGKGDAGDRLVQALKRFQQDYQLPETGDADGQTTAKLESVHAV